jgi:hypothetical protein
MNRDIGVVARFSGLQIRRTCSMQRKTMLAWPVMCALTVAGCSGAPQTALSPSALEPSATFLNPDGSSMKVSAPRDLGPDGGATVDSPTPTLGFTNAVGRLVQVNLAHEVEILDDKGAIVYSRVLGETSGSTSHTVEVDLAWGTAFTWRARARHVDQFGPWSAVATFRTRNATGPQSGANLPRTPDPAPGSRLPLPNMRHVVEFVASQYPNHLLNSCQERRGTWDFMDLVVDTLRTFDNRWGYNWKRGQAGNPSLDVVDYHYGSGPSEGSTSVYIIDIIGGHCGRSPGPSWHDVTQVTRDGGGIGRWTGRGRFTN